MKYRYIDTDKFIKWLSQMGVEILPVTNQYEQVRFKGREVGVLYRSGKTSNKYTAEAIYCFKNNKKWNGKPINIGRKPSYKKEKAKLIERDGTNCFLCGLPLDNDITLEHLIALSCGGKNELSNMVLMHEHCNQTVKNLPISEKVKKAISFRLLNVKSP